MRYNKSTPLLTFYTQPSVDREYYVRKFIRVRKLATLCYFMQIAPDYIR